MSLIRHSDYAFGIDGITLTDHTIGSTQHPLVMAVPQQDPNDDDDNSQAREVYYMLSVPLAATVSINDATVIPVNATQRFRGKVTEIDPDIITDTRWLTVRGKLEAVT